MANISRRTLLKMLMGVSAALAFAPLVSLAQYLKIPYVFKPVRAEIIGAVDMPNNSSLDYLWPTLVRPFDTNVLIRDANGNYTSFNRVCSHLQCLVNYNPDTETIQCPCHGSVYDAHTGEVISGPAPRGLPIIDLELDPDGEVYAINAEGTFGYGQEPATSSTTTNTTSTTG